MFLWPLIIRHWARKWTNWGCLLILPPIIWFIMSTVDNLAVHTDGINVALPGLILNAGLLTGIINLGVNFADIKHSILFKRLRLLGGKYYELIWRFWSFYVGLAIISMVWIWIVAAIFYYSYMHLLWINWIYIFLGLLLAACFSCTVGLIIGYLTKSFLATVLLSIGLYLIFALCSGLFFPLSITITNPILKVISYLMLYSYFVNLINLGWFYFAADYVHNIIGTTQIIDNQWFALSLVCVIDVILFIFLGYCIRQNLQQ